MSENKSSANAAQEESVLVFQESTRLRYNIGMALTGFFYPTWGLMCWYVFNGHEEWVGRIIGGIIPFVIIYFSATKKINYKWTEGLSSLAFIITNVHLVYVCNVNEWRLIYVAGPLLYLAASISLISHLKYGVLYAVSTIAAVCFFAWDQIMSMQILTIIATYVTFFVCFLGMMYERVSLNKNLFLTMGQLSDSERNRQESAKMAVLGEMAGGVAHEINNPIAIIQGQAGMISRALEKEPLNKEKLKSSTDKIISTVERIGKITKGLLTYARNGDADPFINIDLRPVIENTIEIVREKFLALGVTIDVQKNIDVKIDCKETQVAQILMNLLNNAFDAAVGTMQKSGQAAGWIKVEIIEDVAEVKLCVTDCGTGIADHVVAKMTQPFFTTKEIGKGTGMGLSVTEGLVKQHHGKLAYDCETGHTRFTVSLPKQQEGTVPVELDVATDAEAATKVA
ncbi:MAG: sensor histidine kinase [Pseudobdellovibrionaceae bacterium]